MQDFSENTPNDPFFNAHDRSVVPASAVFQDAWPSGGTITQGINGSLSMAGWTEDNEGFIQQSFLGASIRNFNINAGFGGSASTASIDLVNDEYHQSDNTNIGLGDDVYHGGEKDHFNPPVVGSPVFFKFGKNHATIEQAYRKTFDDLYEVNTLEAQEEPRKVPLPLPIEEHPQGFYLSSGTKLDEVHENSSGTVDWIDRRDVLNDRSKSRGIHHFAFGGILQSYTQNRSSAGNPLYNVKLVDPRDILSNAQVILSNYQGTTFNNKNLFNVYGFLEYDPSDNLQNELDFKASSKEVLTKFINPDGTHFFQGQDIYTFANTSVTSVGLPGMENDNVIPKSNSLKMPDIFPVTGQGFARRSSRGIPFYRVSQALSALFQERGYLPKEYRDAGFGGTIDFRGYKYVVDFSGLPIDKIPNMYYLDFDKIDLLSLCQEICDVTSHDLFVSLLPVIDHPACEFLHEYNLEIFDETEDPATMIAGIIRVDAIDRSFAPQAGAIKSYIDDLADNNIFVENQDVGFEVSNVTTDKFVAGAQEVDMHFFSNHKDRDTLQERRARAGSVGGRSNLHLLESEQWSLATSLKQQILPFYGFLGDKAVTIPRGFGAYQQIMLDARNLDAHGVGNYYIATEMELRAASVSYESWEEFLLYYSERYIDEVGQYQALEGEIASQMTVEVEGINSQLPDGSLMSTNLRELLEDGRQFAVSVPRCVFNSDKPNCAFSPGSIVQDGYPASPCSPPFGYPLYYKRAQKIGILRAGIASLYNSIHTCITNIERLRDAADSEASAFASKPEFADALETLLPLQKRMTQVMNALKNHESAGGDKQDAGYISMDAQQASLSSQLSEAQEQIAEAQEAINNAVATEKAMSASIRKVLNANRSLTINLGKSAKLSQKNAKKVYTFIKKIADECLGKKFLVKIPKKTNLNYSDEISWFETHTGNISLGPFGFRPIPISTDPRYSESSAFIEGMGILAGVINADTLFEHYLDSSFSGYTNGALKCNFNPIDEKWEYNYAPENQGGFATFGQYLSQPHKSLLTPVNMQKLINDNNRISAYVRFNHSQFIDFSNIDAKDIEQQSIGGYGQFVPDATESLDNLNPDKSESLDKISSRLTHDRDYQRQAPSVAFVKCTIDDEFYMAPKTEAYSMPVFASNFNIAIYPPDFETIDAKDTRQNIGQDYEYVVNEDGDRERVYFDIPNPTYNCNIKKVVLRRLIPIFGVPLGGGVGLSEMNTDFVRNYDPTFNGNIVETRTDRLDSDHVYAIITLPGKAIPTVDQRFVDSFNTNANVPNIYSILTRDVVKIYPFRTPAFARFSGPRVDCGLETPTWSKYSSSSSYGVDTLTSQMTDEGITTLNGKPAINISFERISAAMQAQRDALKGIALGGDFNLIKFTAPSPVYPDLVALPLMSMERCYGPWLSASDIDGSRIKYSDIGGKIEFVKDESLAPWNFAGYELMNEAGSLKAQFSNSLMLFSERGGFVYPGAPTGVALARALKDKGPLVTSIDVSVSNAVKTTVKMDLYTSRFGKLKKQQEDSINIIARQRQRNIDQTNDAIRRGFAKGQSNNNMLGGLLKNGGQAITNAARVSNNFLTAVEQNNSQAVNTFISSYVQQENGLGAGGGYTAKGTTDKEFNDSQNIIGGSVEQQAALEKTAGADVSEMFAGISYSPSPYFPNFEGQNRASMNDATGFNNVGNGNV